MPRIVPLVLQEFGLTLVDLVFPEIPLENALPTPVEPPFCAQCGEQFPAAISGEFECTNCRGRTWHFQWARARYPFAGGAREAILGFKYQARFYHRRQLARWLEEAFDHHASHIAWDALVPVPLHPIRRRERGFNQAEEIARELSRHHHLPILRCLQRLHETGTQTKLSRDERWHNMLKAFSLRSKFDVTGQNLLLIDDVFTTGATCEGCAHVLHRAGAGIIGVLTVARG